MKGEKLNTCIYVFTGTGTSLAMAEKMGNFLGDAEIKLIPAVLTQAEGKEIAAGAKRVGLIFPNYFGGLPEMVKKFVRCLNFDQTDYIFSIVTGGGGAGLCFPFLDEELKKRGKKLDYGRRVVGTSNYIVAWYYQLVCKTGERRIKVIHNLHNKIEGFAGEIASGKHKVEKGQTFSYRLSLLLTPKSIVADTRPWDKEFSVSGNCIGCKTCEKVCQAKNIKIIDRRPVFQHNCQRCMACIQYCPQHAIGMNGKPLLKPRYFHPDYPAKDLIRAIDHIT